MHMLSLVNDINMHVTVFPNTCVMHMYIIVCNINWHDDFTPDYFDRVNMEHTFCNNDGFGSIALISVC